MRATLILAGLIGLAGCTPPDDRPEIPPTTPVIAVGGGSVPRPALVQPAVKRPPPIARPEPMYPSLDMGDELRACDTYDGLFVSAARRYLPWGTKEEGAKWLKCQAFRESSCRPKVCAKESTACGMFQHLEGTGKDLGIVDRLDPAQSVNGGARYDAYQYGQWQAHDRTPLQRWRLALDGYYRGLGGPLGDQKEHGCIYWQGCFENYAPPLAVHYVESISACTGYPPA